MHEGACPGVHNPHIAAGDLQQPIIHCVGAAQRLQQYTQNFSRAIAIVKFYSKVIPCVLAA